MGELTIIFRILNGEAFSAAKNGELISAAGKAELISAAGSGELFSAADAPSSLGGGGIGSLTGVFSW